ncbi:MAG TPA: sigma-70 family RNA polymerase sigma factor, partial [Pyrinomonadaceae bacterium]|nr:sigma-70 family RNA polymerase sigma factor [Pyrinomonadaceae bacterium]
MTSESELIRRAQSGEREAFCQLAKNYERRIYALALHYCRHAADAEDLSQEVWLKAFRAIGGFRAESGFYTWLRQITVNTFLNGRRAETLTRDEVRTRVRLDSLSEMLDGAAMVPELSQRDSENGFHRRLMVGRVMRALGELTPQQRLVFLLKHQEGMTYEEIARALDCSPGTAKKAVFRAVTRLRA